MSWFGEYLLGVAAAAFFCSLCAKLTGDTAYGKLIKMICGIVMLLAVAAPWTKLEIGDFDRISADIAEQAQESAQAGQDAAYQKLREGITRKTTAYILDEAKRLDAQIQVEVELTDDQWPVPCSVTVSGAISPYARQMLSELIRDQLGISTEDQKWIS